MNKQHSYVVLESNRYIAARFATKAAAERYAVDAKRMTHHTLSVHTADDAALIISGKPPHRWGERS